MILSDLQADNIVVTTNLKCEYLPSGLIQADGDGNIVNASSFQVAGSTFTPTITNQTGLSSLTVGQYYYSRVMSTVTCSASFTISNLLTSSSFDINVPVSPGSNFTSDSVIGMGTTYNTGLTNVGSLPIVTSVSSTQTVRVRIPGLVLGTWLIKIMFQYIV